MSGRKGLKIGKTNPSAESEKELNDKLAKIKEENSKKCTEEINVLMKKYNCNFLITLGNSPVNIGINGMPLSVAIASN